MSYVGRFAPSPTGPLHLGSLATAVASFMHARQASGEWLVRIEDIDPPREVPGAADDILRTLEAFELEWDRPVLFQSRRLAAYDAAAERLLAERRAFHCRCSRSEIRAANEGESGRYPGTCRELRIPPGDAAVRVRVDPGRVIFDDGVQGTIETDLLASLGDYVVVRRDGLPAYHLAVVLDDAEQGVTTIVRGVDLLDSTAAHVHLQGALGLATPRYYHLPVVVNERGQKLSKQTGATAVDARDGTAAARVLAVLGLAVPPALEGERPGVLWRWAAERWSIDSLRGQRELTRGTVSSAEAPL
ncbi:MAG TPA: tRNA glutamyl-Q(34) synthetase GluQRS [Gammaproteobacteria bacterium]|nr:tRNA glutamyl-Q(34) synthetase GluQRS [Gammaproteobacteria bacterium]